MPTFAQKRAEERKRNILKAAADVFKEKGYHNATVEEIANRLSLTKGSVYYYIESKEDLLYQCHDMAMNLLLEKAKIVLESKESPEIRLKKLIDSHVDTVIDELSFITVLLQQEYALSEEHFEKIVEKRDLYDDILIQILDDGIDKKVFKEVDASLMRFLIFGAINWIPHWYKKSGDKTKAEISNFFAEQLVNSILYKKS